MTVDSDRAEKANEALTEARRGITHQAAALDELRSRTGLLLAASSISAAVLGSTLSQGSGFGVLGICSGIAFLLTIVKCIQVLYPKTDGWIFTSNAEILVEDWAKIDERSLSEMREFIAECLQGHQSKNKTAYDGLVAHFQFAALATGAQVILAVIQLSMS